MSETSLHQNPSRDSCKYRNNRAEEEERDREKNSRNQVVDEHHAVDTRSHESVLRTDRKSDAFLALCSAPWDTCLFPVLGMVPVRDRTRTAASPLQCGHHVAPAVPRKGETRQRKPLREGGRAPEAPQRESTKTQNPFPPFVCSILCGVATQRVLQTLCGKSAESACN